MIYGTGPVREGYEQYLDDLQADCLVEQTDDGFEYAVVDSDRIANPHAITGLVKHTPELIEVNLVLSSGINPNVRPKIAEIVIAMAGMDDYSLPAEYLLCETGQKLLPTFDTETRQAVAETLYNNLNGYKEWVEYQDKNRNYQAVPARDRRQLRHSMGWVALEREMSDEGKEMVDKMLDLELNVLPRSEKEVLFARGQGHLKGVGITVYSTQEKGNHHRCRCCSGEIHKGTVRVTASYDTKIRGFDHHHYHPVCYAETDMRLLDLTSARFIKSEW